MSEPKKAELFEKTREIISKFDVQGISQNELIRLLRKYGVASRNTFYKHFKEMIDPNGANIIELRNVGGLTKKCFPTKENSILLKTKEKFVVAEKLLSFVEEKSDIGDCYSATIELKNFPELTNGPKGQQLNSLLPTNIDCIYHDELFIFHEDLKGENFELVWSNNGRRDFLKDLSTFLVNFIYHPKNKFSNQLKEELMKMITTLITKSLKIYQHDYYEYPNNSIQFYDKCKKNLKKNMILFIMLDKGVALPDIETEFLKTLGRYYYCISRKFSKNMKYNSCKEQKVISNFIKAFFQDRKLEHNVDKKYSNNELLNIINETKNASLVSSKGEKDSLVAKLRKSLTGKLIQLFVDSENYFDDNHTIKEYYFGLFFELDLFSNVEKQILRYVLKAERDL